MKCGVILTVVGLGIGCAPSLIQRNVDEERRISYEISKADDIKLKGYVMKAADSITNCAIKKYVEQADAINDIQLKIHINELKWLCPDSAQVYAEQFAMGYGGGLLAQSVWGTMNTTGVQGISDITVNVVGADKDADYAFKDTIRFDALQMNWKTKKTIKRSIATAYTKSLDGLFLKMAWKKNGKDSE